MKKEGIRKNTKKPSRSRKGSWEKRMAKKIDFLCLIASGAILLAAAALELMDRKKTGPRPLR